ncbi:MAG TPA: tryptophan synthase subunit alpha [Fulvivirga sp.]|nr:tryptophan synthase subunit alpha [Fulvivirga sp.]
MNRINKLFKEREGDILSVYFTAGYPQLDDTLKIAKSLEEAGADLIEIGMPFSDPVADGPTIQESNKKALDNGMSIKVLFDQLKELRKEVSMPVILMGYINPILQYGVEQFCESCKAVGVDGLIIPDLPIAEYLKTHKTVFDKYDLKNVFLVTPQTSVERILTIDQHSDSFIYMVSSAGTTGAKTAFSEENTKYFKRINNMGLANPTLIGFGISNSETFQQAAHYSRGAIIGSAFIKLLATSKERDSISEFVKEIRGKMQDKRQKK